MLLLRIVSDQCRPDHLLLSVLDTNTTPSLSLFSASAKGTIACLPDLLRQSSSVRILLSPDWKVTDVQLFGRYGIIELIGHRSDESPGSNDDASLYIIGVTGSSVDWTADNLIRVSNSDHRTLVALLGHEKELTIEYMSRDLALSIPNLPQISKYSDNESARARLVHWATTIPLAATPFLIPNAAEAQCASPSSGNYDSGTNYSGVDFDHIIDSDEGGNATAGYVPSSTSGVTIAGGLDLGVNDAADLSADGVPQNLIDQFQPFLAPGSGQTLVGADATAALNANPAAAQITEAQANQINQAVYNTYSNQVAVAFNNASPNMMFTDLNVQWQTVIVSMYYQAKSIVNTQFFSQVANGQWSAAIANLQNFGGPSSAQNNRAKKNADYLTNSGCTNGTTNGG